KLLRRYGVEVEELRGVEKVELNMGSRKIVVSSPQVIAFKMHGQVIYQVSGKEEVVEEQKQAEKPEVPVAVSEDDVKFIVDYTGVTREKAVEALIKAKGDLAKAIMIIRGEEKT
ncbi:MAG: nascent polypeptide-associated complex protein, partial [Desulfurococcaceae archaeon]